MSTEELRKKIDLLMYLEKQYKTKYRNLNDIFPDEWYMIDLMDFNTKIKLLNKSLKDNKLLCELNFIKNLKLLKTKKIINESIKKSKNK